MAIMYLTKIKEYIMKNKETIFTKLVKQGNGYSTRAILVLAATVMGILLLGTLMAGMIVDICTNHTITMSLPDAAVFIASITSLWTGAGLTKAIGKKSTIETEESTEETVETEEES